MPLPVPLDHVMIQVYGPRNQLLGHIRVPGTDLSAFAVVLDDAQRAQPGYTVGSVVRWMLRLGCERAHLAVSRGAVPTPWRLTAGGAKKKQPTAPEEGLTAK